MEDDTTQNEHNRLKRSDGDETLAELMAGYTPKQRETFLKGFRILADVARPRPHRTPSAGIPRHAGRQRRGGGGGLMPARPTLTVISLGRLGTNSCRHIPSSGILYGIVRSEGDRRAAFH